MMLINFNPACCNRTRASGSKLKEYSVDVRKKLFTVRVLRYLHKWPRGAGIAPSLGMFRAGLNGALINLV